MKIGIFTDTYRPSLNGIVYVTEILRRNFELLGHEVYIFAPAAGFRSKDDNLTDPHIISFPAVPGIVFEDFNSSLFFPPKVLRQIQDHNFDVIHCLTPGPVGLMGMYAAHKLDTPLVAEYCTDLFEYVEHYPLSILAISSLGLVLPFAFKTTREDVLDMIKAARPRFGAAQWNRGMIKHLITVIHSNCDAVIAHSRKSAQQMEGWQDEDNKYAIDIIPTGVDALPKPSAKQRAAFCKKWRISPDDEVIAYVGRLSPEKNLDMLIEMIAELAKWRPNVKLLYAGDFAEYRPKLEEKAAASPAAKRIIFTGRIPREQLGIALDVAKVFAFPSLTDTQSLALHEAAQAGLPIVMVDEPVTEVVHEGINGYFCQDDPIDMAAKINHVLEDRRAYRQMSSASRKIARTFSERTQCKKILQRYKQIIAQKSKV